MRPISVLDLSLSSRSQESFGDVMQAIVAGVDVSPQAAVVSGGTTPLLFGRYRTVRELGRGGMGIVWLVHDTVLDIPVALKLVPEEIVHDTEGIVNLKKEVLRGMALTHPGIVRVHGFEQQEKTAGIVMEHVNGESLAEKKSSQPDRCFGVEEVRPWLEQLCAALDYAHHEARIAHRDLKPGNLLLTSTGRMKIVDFGLASSLSETRSRISVRLGVSGTPPYMSPQQLMGQRPTHLDDLYSLGATLYELITGTPPFFRGDIVSQIMREAPQPLASRRAEFCVTNHSPIPIAWERAIAACLAKDPAARPSSAAEIIEILDKLKVRAVAPVPIESVAPHDGAVRAQPVETLWDPTDAKVDNNRSSIAPASLESATEMRLIPVALPQAETRNALQSALSKSVQRVHPRPVPWRAPQRINFQPLLGATASILHGVAAAVRGLADLLLSVLRPLFKMAAVLAALWGLLHLKQKWDAGAGERQAAATTRLPLPASAPPPPQVIINPPSPLPPSAAPAFGPPGGRPEFGPSGAQPPAPPPPPPRPPRR